MFLKRIMHAIRRAFAWFWGISRTKKIVIIIILLGVIYWNYQSGKNEGITVTLATAHTADLEQTLSASGEVTATDVANLTFPTIGKVAWVGVTEGDWVKKGQSVASLDKAQLQLTLKKYLNTFEKQFTTFDDTQDSVEDKVLDDAVTRIKKRAQADLNQTVLDVELQNEAIKLASLNSPIAGIVTKVQPAVSGVTAGPTNSSYQIVNPDSVYFEAEVNEVDIPKIKEGTPTEIELTAFPEETIHEEVETIGFSNVVTSSGGTAYKVKIPLPKHDQLLYRLGMNGDVKFILGKKEHVLLVPGTAIVENAGKSYVWVVTNENVAEKTEVETGETSIDETEIVKGLSEGDQIIDRPGKEIVEGVKVKNDK